MFVHLLNQPAINVQGELASSGEFTWAMMCNSDFTLLFSCP